MQLPDSNDQANAEEAPEYKEDATEEPNTIIKKPNPTQPQSKQASKLSKAQQIQPPMIMPKQSRFQPTHVGIIYEEISLLDSLDDTR